ncbi:hypothetical protein Jann_3014 [Jannaschia sp. CCS1]|nr:hypothetical protein Jann_3014 [Jannaschia sp. CCS1]
MSDLVVKHFQSSRESILAIGVMRVTALTEPLSAAAFAEPGVALLDAFLEHFGSDVVFVAKGSTQGNKTSNLTKATDRRLAEYRGIVADGGMDTFGIRLYGGDDTRLGKPLVPFASLSHHLTPTIIGPEPRFFDIDFALPPEGSATEAFLRDSNKILGTLPLRAGFQGLGFASSPVVGGRNRDWAPAFKRYQTAIMLELRLSPSLVFLNPYRSKSKGAYTPGLPDIGWRTYVGAEFAARLGPPPDHPNVSSEQLGDLTIVTAGERPIWGDLNSGEDISAYQAAAAYLNPAMASRNIRVREAPGYRHTDATRRELGEAYLDRLAPAKNDKGAEGARS